VPPAVEPDARRPKVVLHDHLDGGVRPGTVAELAAASGLTLPVPAQDLADWFTIVPGLPVLDAWQRFALVIDVLQSADGLARVAREAVEDLAGDGVVYAELRFAPLEHTRGGLGPDEVVAAVVDALAAAEAATGTVARVIVCGLREQPPERALAAAELAARWAGRGVVGFDLAGLEPGNPASRCTDAFRTARAAGLGITVHAGEMDGVASIRDAFDAVRPDRIGHGWRIIEDCTAAGGVIVRLGPTARAVLEAGTPLELCPTSNACLGLPIEQHPVRLLADAGFRISVNPDDRAITTTTTSREHALLAEHHRFTDGELRAIGRVSLADAFCDDATRARVASRLDR
jgi:adenosine deaminase